MLSAAQTPLPAFEHVYRGQFDFVLRTLRALGVPESGLDDAVQDVFIVVHRRLPEFEGRASVKTWAYEIARRVALRYRTRAAREAARHAELPARLGSGVDLEDAMEHVRAAEVLRRFLDDLDEDRRRAFVLAELWEMSGREIAESLGINMNTVYARIRSARTELDRVAHRMHARDASAVTRSLREHRASARTQERARAGVLVAVGSGAGTGMTGLATLGWAGLGVAVCALGVVATVSVSTPEDAGPGMTPPPTSSTAARVPSGAHVPAPVAVAAASSPQPVVSPPDPGVPATPKPRVQPTEPAAVSLPEQLAAVQRIRRAVQAEDVVKAREQISKYRSSVPGGALMDEVDALEVELACRTQAVGASGKLRVFAEAHRGSALVDRLTILCSSKIGPQKPSQPKTQGP